LYDLYTYIVLSLTIIHFFISVVSREKERERERKKDWLYSERKGNYVKGMSLDEKETCSLTGKKL